LNMDLPIAIALFLAWGGSIVNMMLGGDHVYFESAAMFVFFLLISRWLEQHQRHRIQREWQRLQDALPQVVRKVTTGDDYRDRKVGKDCSSCGAERACKRRGAHSERALWRR